MGSRRFVVGLLLIVAFAFAGRALYIFTVTRDELTIDQIYFNRGAQQLADGEAFKAPAIFGTGENAEHPPLPIVLLAPVALVSGGNDPSMRLLVAFAGAAAVALIALIARELAGERTALIAAAIAAVYPNLWINDGIFMSETFATVFTAASVYACYRLLRGPTLVRALAVGGAVALAMLSRAELALLVPLLVVPTVLMIPGIDWARRVRVAGVAFVATFVLVGPWIGYNLVRFEKPVLLSSGDGGVLAGANCSKTYAGSDLGSWNGYCLLGQTRHRRSAELVSYGDRSVQDAAAREVGLKYMREHVERLPVVVTARVARVWSFFHPFQMARLAEGEGKPEWASRAGLGAYWLLLGFSVAGVFVLRRRGERVFPLLAPVVAVTLVAAALYGLVRFRAPAEVSIVVLAAVTIDQLVGRRRSTERVPAPQERGLRNPVW